ncbi:MAG TPA: 3-oxoadipate enol-lactonase [Acidiphilium sp.]
MPFAAHDGVRLYWKLEGEAERPPLVLLHAIGTDMGLWDAAAPELLKSFRLLRVDVRGHGASDAPAGDYSLGILVADVLAAMDAAGIGKAAVAGVSLGGMIAMEMAFAAPDRVAALALVCTSAVLDSALWAERIVAVRANGVAAIAEAAMGRYLSPGFATAHPGIAASIRNTLLSTPADGYAGAGAAIRDMDLIGRLPDIAVPTLVVAGDRDVSTPFAGHGERIAAAIPGARVLHLDAAHLAPVEAPEALAAGLRDFLLPSTELRDAETALAEAGTANRRRVLGDAWVDRSLANRTAFNADFQAMIARIAWHEIWSRPGLDERMRRLLVIAITASLGRWEEFRLHVRAGLERGGFSRDDLREVLMQTAIYAGVPAANTAFTEAASVIAALDKAG